MSLANAVKTKMFLTLLDGFLPSLELQRVFEEVDVLHVNASINFSSDSSRLASFLSDSSSDPTAA
eukprot:13905052-Ditylum_brightwellii.AAC.1